MKKLLEKLKLIQYFNSELTTSKEEFLEMIKEKVDQEKPGFLSDSFDAWTSHKNKFKGIIENNKIVFKRRQTFFNTIACIPEATITISEIGSQINVITKINGLKGPLLILSIFTLIAIPINLFFAIRLMNHSEMIENNLLLIMLFVPSLMFFKVYIFMRIGIGSLKKRISAELYKLVQD